MEMNVLLRPPSQMEINTLPPPPRLLMVWWCMVVYGGACWCMAVSDGDDDAETLPGSTTSSIGSPEEGEFYAGGVLYTAQWCCMEYRRHKSRRSGIYLPSPAEPVIVVLKDWSFVALDPIRTPMHLGFKVTGTLVNHPREHDSEGRDWSSSEIRGIHKNWMVQCSHTTLYRLEGPAAPGRHQSPSGLADIMQPFCNWIWPSNAESLFAQVSKLFLSLREVPGKTSDPIQSPLPSSSRPRRSRTSATHHGSPPSAKAQRTDSAATAGSRGMWCMMVVVYGGVYNHILMILKVRPFLKVAAAAVALLATTAYLSKKLLVRISTIRQKKNFFVCFVQKGTILFREASGRETFASNALFVWVNYGQVLTGAMRGKYPALVPT